MGRASLAAGHGRSGGARRGSDWRPSAKRGGREVERPFQRRPAHDRADRAGVADRREVLERADAARREHGPARARRPPERPRRRARARSPTRRTPRHEERPTAVRREPRQRSPPGRGRRDPCAPRLDPFAVDLDPDRQRARRSARASPVTSAAVRPAPPNRARPGRRPGLEEPRDLASPWPTPPLACTGTSRAGERRATTRGSRGSPSNARSMSTTWSAARPGLEERARGGNGSPPKASSGTGPSGGEPGQPAVGQVERREQRRTPSRERYRR